MLAAQDLKKSEKAAAEELRQVIQRVSAKKLIWKRCQIQLLDQYNTDASKLTQAELLERAFQVWRERVKTVGASRRARIREREQYKQTLVQWVQKKEQARALVAERNEQRLPSAVRPGTVNESTLHRKELVRVLEDWPAPQPSPYYNLRVFGVLHEAATRPATSAPLLPLLKERQIRSGGGKLLDTKEVLDAGDQVKFVDDRGRARKSQDLWYGQSDCFGLFEFEDVDEIAGEEMPDLSAYGSEVEVKESWQAFDNLDEAYSIAGDTEDVDDNAMVLPKLMLGPPTPRS
jgi:hypothetical protein